MKQNLIGKRFGKLIVLEEYGKDKWGSTIWKCKCDCGNYNYVATKNLNAGVTKSCGCGSIETRFQRKIDFSSNEYDLSSYDYGVCLIKGIKVLFDKEDYDLIKDYIWNVAKNNYVKSNCKTNGEILDKTVRMHILITHSDPKKYDVDHKNHIITDNRKSNLRIVLHNENLMNTKLYSNNTTGVKGVYWDKSRKKWMACITAYKKTYHLGRFDKFEDAVKARKDAELKYHGEYRNKELD